jgi:thymidine kinase
MEPQFRSLRDGENTHQAGWIEVVAGCMFSGKTEELIRRLKRAVIAKQNVEIFKPTIDTRYHLENIVSHNNNSIRSTPVTSAKEIILRAVDCNVVGIDEAQFFGDDLAEVCNMLAFQGKRVIVAGLDMDFSGKPFGPMPALLAIADYVSKVHAICMVCGAPAGYSYRLVKNNDTLLLGETNIYEARCRTCFNQSEALPPDYES